MDSGKRMQAGDKYSLIPFKDLPNFVNEPVHLSWANIGAVWILKEILPDGRVLLMTPKTKKCRYGGAHEVTYTSKSEPGPQTATAV